MRIASFAGCLSVLVFTAACGDPVGRVGVGENRDRFRDGGYDDGGTDGGATADGAMPAGDGGGMVGATMDAAVLDLDASLMLPDGSWFLADGAILLPDGRVIDVDAALGEYGPEPDVSRCEISDDDAWSKAVEIEHEGGFALVPGPTGFGLAYRAVGSGTCSQNIEVMHIPATMGFPEPRALLASECPAITDVTLASVAGQWQLAWVDNLTLSAELHSAELDDDMSYMPDHRRTLTDNVNQLELKPVLESVAGRPLLAWVTRNGDARRISAQWLDGDAEPVDVVDEDDDHLPQSLALSQIASENAAVAWAGAVESPGVWLVPLDASGMPAAEPVQLNGRASTSSSVDLAYHPEGGAAVYSIEIDGLPQVRFRRLDGSGMPIGEERVVVGPPLRAQDASIFGVAGGYAIAYRALPGGSITAPQIRMTFVSKEGAPMRDAAGSLLSFTIAETSFATARTQLTVSPEGQIMIAWIGAGGDSDDNLLNVVRRRLDCN